MDEPLAVRVQQPTDWLNANQRLHWSERNRRTSLWRQVTGWQVRSLRPPGPYERPVLVVATITLGAKDRVRDIGNLAPTVKACVDGVVDAGLLTDDDDRHVVGPDIRRDPERAPLGCGVVLLTFQPYGGT